MKTDIRLPLGLPEFTVLKQEITENKVVIQVETTGLFDHPTQALALYQLSENL